MFKKFISMIFMVTLLSVIIIGCSNAGQDSIEDTENQVGENHKEDSTEGEEKVEEKDRIQEKIEDMTLEEKVGQMVIVGLEGYQINEQAREMIEDYKVGGFIFFSDNIETSDQISGLISELDQVNRVNDSPLFFSVDEEGGRVSRLPDEFENMPANREIGDINDLQYSYRVGKTIGDQISSLGFNMNFAPVLDIDSNPNNPVIGNRSFGASPELVSELGVETMEGMESTGIIPVVKHFPGHGDTDVDSHLGLPTIDKSLEELRDFEIVPFKRAIENDARAVMVAHILYKNLDSEYPSTMSEHVIQGILRGELGFKGLVITDDMTMGAITENYDIGGASIRSVKAGSDIVLVCHGYENEVSVLESLKEAVEGGDISEQRINESVYRILEVKEGL